MTPEEYSKLDDLIVKAVQSGKKETSDLVDHVIHKMEKQIESSINKNVNGKIDKINVKMDSYIEADLKWKEEDKAWKDTATPYIDMVKGVKNFGTIGTIILKTILLVGGVVGAFYALINFLKE